MPSTNGSSVSVTTSVTELAEATASREPNYKVILTNEGASTVFVSTLATGLASTSYMWRLPPSAELTLDRSDGAHEGVHGRVASGTCAVHVATRIA